MPMFNGRPVTPGQYIVLKELTRDLNVKVAPTPKKPTKKGK